MSVVLREDQGVQLCEGHFSDLDKSSFRGMVGANWDQSRFRREGRRKQTARIGSLESCLLPRESK